MSLISIFQPTSLTIDQPDLIDRGGFSRKEISRIQQIIQEHQVQLMEGWNEYFGR